MSSLCLMCFELVLANPSGSQEADRGHRLPILVRLGKSEVQERTAALFAEIVPLLTTDPAIDLRNTFNSLMVTQIHLIIRFGMYDRFPNRLWRLTKKYNSSAYATEILDFLNTDDSELDCGYSVPLKQEAWHRGSDIEADATGYLMSSDVQNELNGIFEIGSGSSLDVERKHAHDLIVKVELGSSNVHTNVIGLVIVHLSWRTVRMCSGPMAMVHINPCSDGEGASEPEDRSHVQRSDGDDESEPEITSAVQRREIVSRCCLDTSPSLTASFAILGQAV